MKQEQLDTSRFDPDAYQKVGDKWDEERKRRLDNEAQLHSARMQEMADLIRHRAAWERLIEREVSALERIATSLERPVVITEQTR